MSCQKTGEVTNTCNSVTYCATLCVLNLTRYGWHVPLQLDDSLVLLQTFRLQLPQKSQHSLDFSIRLLLFLFMTDSFRLEHLQPLRQLRVPASNMLRFTRLHSRQTNTTSANFIHLVNILKTTIFH